MPHRHIVDEIWFKFYMYVICCGRNMFVPVQTVPVWSAMSIALGSNLLQLQLQLCNHHNHRRHHAKNKKKRTGTMWVSIRQSERSSLSITFVSSISILHYRLMSQRTIHRTMCSVHRSCALWTVRHQHSARLSARPNVFVWTIWSDWYRSIIVAKMCLATTKSHDNEWSYHQNLPIHAHFGLKHFSWTKFMLNQTYYCYVPNKERQTKLSLFLCICIVSTMISYCFFKLSAFLASQQKWPHNRNWM